MLTLSKEEINQLFGSVFPFWDKLGEEDRSILIGSSDRVRFKRGATVHNGEHCTGIILVKSGSLRIYMLSDEGKEITLFRPMAGDICILSASCVLSTVTFDVVIDAEEDSECIIVGGCAYQSLAERIPEAKIFALEEALSDFSDVMWVIQQILFMSMDKRLAIFLLDEMNSKKSDTIRLTHEQIAKYIGSAREVVTRMLKYFSKEGIIEASRACGIKILDKKRLRALTS